MFVIILVLNVIISGVGVKENAPALALAGGANVLLALAGLFVSRYADEDLEDL